VTLPAPLPKQPLARVTVSGASGEASGLSKGALRGGLGARPHFWAAAADGTLSLRVPLALLMIELNYAIKRGWLRGAEAFTEETLRRSLLVLGFSPNFPLRLPLGPVK